MKAITQDVAKANLQPGDRVVIPSGLGGVYDARLECLADGQAKVSVLSKDHGGELTVNLDDVRVPVLCRNAAGDPLALVRDNEHQYLVVEDHDVYRPVFTLPETTPYRDRAQLEKGLAVAVGAKLYFEEMAPHIQKRMPSADITALNEVLSKIENGAWVAPTAVEAAALQAGVRIDLTDWCDAEMLAPVAAQPDVCVRQLQALQKAARSLGIDADIQARPDFDWGEHPIKTAGGVGLAVQFAQRYLEERNLADTIEVCTTDEVNVEFIIAADIAITVDGNRWHYEPIRPFSAKNEAWLTEKRSSFEHITSVDPLDDDTLGVRQTATPSPSL